jgi:hypothetical protein
MITDYVFCSVNIYETRREIPPAWPAPLTKGGQGDLSCNDTNLLLNIRIDLHFAEQEI